MDRRDETPTAAELRVLAAVARAATAASGVHGFRVATALRAGSRGGRMIGHGTLYAALGRLVGAGLLSDEWEAPEAAETESRPPRRSYRVSALGERVLDARATADRDAAPIVRPATGAAS